MNRLSSSSCTIPEAATVLRMSEKSVRRQIDRGHLRKCKAFGRSVRSRFKSNFISSIIGTWRTCQFFVPVIASPVTRILPFSKSQSAHVILLASPFRKPPNAKKRTKSAQRYFHPPSVVSIALIKSMNCFLLGSSKVLRRTRALLKNLAGLS